MASTRNKNTRSDYCLEQNINNNLNTYLLYQNASYGQAYNSAFPGDYVNMGKMPNTVLSKNSTDIESTLFGIGSSNLVNPKAPTQARLYNMNEVKFVDRMKVVLPEPLVVENNQRPYPIP